MAKLSHEAVKNQQYAGTHNWNILLESVPSALLGLAISTGVTSSTGKVNLLAETATVPASALTIGEAKMRGTIVKQVMQVEPEGTIDITFLENDKYDIRKFFHTWKELGMSQETSIQLPKSEILLPNGFVMFLEDGEGNNTTKYVLKQSIPSNVSTGELTGEGAIQRVTVTMNYTIFVETSV